MYVELLRDEASKYVFIVGICARWGCGEEEVVQFPKPLLNGDSQETPSPLTTASTGNQPASGMHDLAFSF
jgi:hypothetical protein